MSDQLQPTGKITEALKAQPGMLALLIINVLFLLLIYWGVSSQQERLFELVKSCTGALK